MSVCANAMLRQQHSVCVAQIWGGGVGAGLLASLAQQ